MISRGGRVSLSLRNCSLDAAELENMQSNFRTDNRMPQCAMLVNRDKCSW